MIIGIDDAKVAAYNGELLLIKPHGWKRGRIQLEETFDEWGADLISFRQACVVLDCNRGTLGRWHAAGYITVYRMRNAPKRSKLWCKKSEIRAALVPIPRTEDLFLCS